MASHLDQLHPASFVDTGFCMGPRNIRNQPSRETPGILLADKYSSPDESSVDFNLPFRSAMYQTKMLEMMYKRLDPEQKKIINDKLGFIQPTNIEHFATLYDAASPVPVVVQKSMSPEEIFGYIVLAIAGVFCLYFFFKWVATLL